MSNFLITIKPGEAFTVHEDKIQEITLTNPRHKEWDLVIEYNDDDVKRTKKIFGIKDVMFHSLDQTIAFMSKVIRGEHD